MDGEISRTEIQEFVASNGLDIDLLDEREETLEALQREFNLFIRGFGNCLQDRFSVIEHRLDRLEQLVEERY
ncbi:MAG: hypothetical protein ABSB10_03440 [Candidatus Bathyarchaeia archaeon]|jgi:hypothetical protein